MLKIVPFKKFFQVTSNGMTIAQFTDMDAAQQYVVCANVCDILYAIVGRYKVFKKTRINIYP